MLVPIGGVQKDLLKFLETQREALSAVKVEIEANWRLQIMMMAFGLAILLGVGSEVIESFTNLVGENKILADNLGAKAISFLSLFYFFRFGILLGEYRKSKLTAIVTKNEFNEQCPQYSFMVRDNDSTNSQFDIFLKGDDSPSDSWAQQYGILAYIIVLTSLMHAVGIVLAWNWTGQTHLAVKIVPTFVYVVGLVGMYAVHLKHFSTDLEDTQVLGHEGAYQPSTREKAVAFILSVQTRAKWCVILTGVVTVVWIVVAFWLLEQPLV